MGDRGHNRHGPKRGACCGVPFAGGGLGPRLTQVAWAEVYFRNKWHLHPSRRLATIDISRNSGTLPRLEGGESWDLSNTMSPGPRFTSVPSGMLIHPAVWPQ